MAEYLRQHVGIMWADDYKFLPFAEKKIDQFQLAQYVEQGYKYNKSFNCQIYSIDHIVDKRTKGQKDKRTKGQKDKRTKGQKDKSTKGQKDKRTNGQKVLVRAFFCFCLFVFVALLSQKHFLNGQYMIFPNTKHFSPNMILLRWPYGSFYGLLVNIGIWSV